MKFSLNDINKILCEIKNFNKSRKENIEFNNVSIDSRNLLPNDLFIALKGLNHDGHDFLDEAISKGIKAVVIKNGMQSLLPSNFPYWAVPETLEAFQKLALLKRQRLNIPVVAITGSVGKTTTKEMTAEVLKRYKKVNFSKENYNNEIGMGLTILDTDVHDELLILEMGMRALGQIENLSKFSEPDIAVITNIGTAHIGLLGSQENIATAKCEITKYLNPNGVVIIPNNDLLLDKTLKSKWSGRIVKVEMIKDDKRINNLIVNQRNIFGTYNQSNKIINIDGKMFNISSNGFHNVLNFLFAYAISKEFNIVFNDFNKFNFKSLNGRNKLIKKSKTLIMDETYNASPESVKACIDLLLDYPGRHFLVLGSMKELGIESKKLHLKIFDYISQKDIKKSILLCDINEKKYFEEYSNYKDKILFINDISKISNILNKLTKKGDSILVKGSRFWKLEKIIPLID